MQDDWVTVGRVRTVFGVKGWLKIESFTEPADNILQYAGWRLVADERARKPISIQLSDIDRRDNGILIRLAGVENREEAKQFANHLIQVAKSELPELDSDDYYWHELEGLDVFQVDSEGGEPKPIGRIISLLETGANDVLVVRSFSEDGYGDEKDASRDKDKRGQSRTPEEILIPYLPDDVVKQVNLDTGQVWVDWDYRD